MRLESYMDDTPILTENLIGKLLSGVKNLKKKALEKLFKKSWIQLAGWAREAGVEDKILGLVNSKLNTTYKSLDQATKAKVQENTQLNEDWKHWWEVISSEGFFNIKFYPALQVWFGMPNVITSLLKGAPVDPTTLKKVAFFGILWLALSSGVFMKDFLKWKRGNQDEYYAERPKLIKKHGYVFKDPKMDPSKPKSRGLRAEDF